MLFTVQNLGHWNHYMKKMGSRIYSYLKPNLVGLDQDKIHFSHLVQIDFSWRSRADCYERTSVVSCRCRHNQDGSDKVYHLVHTPKNCMWSTTGFRNMIHHCTTRNEIVARTWSRTWPTSIALTIWYIVNLNTAKTPCLRSHCWGSD
jgi:hypothetical protein